MTTSPKKHQALIEAAMKSWGADMGSYMDKVMAAHNFAKGYEGVVWNGMFTMGLAMNGLALIPISTVITPEPYWIKAPRANGDLPDWDDSWIAEANAFNNVEKNVPVSW